MPAPVSIIIPTLNSADCLPATLSALSEGVHAGLIRELILVDGGSTDQTCALAEAVGAEVIASAAGRGQQLALGADQARGDWLMFLHADSVLEADWSAQVRLHLGDYPQKAGYFRLAFDTAGFPARWTAAWANLRARLFGLPYGDQGLLIAREHYRTVGGFDAIPLMEDVAMARKLHRQMRPVRACITTSAARYRARGWLRQGAGNLLTLLRYFLGSPPETLARSYRRRR